MRKIAFLLVAILAIGFLPACSGLFDAEPSTSPSFTINNHSPSAARVDGDSNSPGTNAWADRNTERTSGDQATGDASGELDLPGG